MCWTSDTREMGFASSLRASGGGGIRSTPITADGTAGGSFLPRASGWICGRRLDQYAEDERAKFEESHAPLSGENPDFPLNRLRSRRSNWMTTMRQMGTLCALTLSIIASGYHMEWDPIKGPALGNFMGNNALL